MSAPGRCAKASSCDSGSHPAPGFLPARVMVTAVSGQTRNRSSLAAGSGARPKMSRGGRRNRMVTSVAVTGRHLPARIKTGTPAQRQVSAVRRHALDVVVALVLAAHGVLRGQ